MAEARELRHPWEGYVHRMYVGLWFAEQEALIVLNVHQCHGFVRTLGSDAPDPIVEIFALRSPVSAKLIDVEGSAVSVAGQLRKDLHHWCLHAVRFMAALQGLYLDELSFRAKDEDHDATTSQ